MPTYMDSFPAADWLSLNDPIPVLDYWRMATPLRDDIDSVYFPHVNTLPWPLGTKGEYISPEAALRQGNLLGINLFGTEGKIRKYAEKRNAHIIGEGAVAFPPCDPQPYCAILEVLKKKIAGVSEDRVIAPDLAALVLPLPDEDRSRRRVTRRTKGGCQGTQLCGSSFLAVT
mmetsp:Transcript_62581/g.117067  ORF Transcript_62581/g.117067 Transcript_62581/m.117067 type:complete len:172 (+) Transcript_62581:51-566(+)